MREHHKKDHKRSQVKCPECMVPIRYARVGRHKCKQASKHEYVRKALEAREARRGLRTHILKEGERLQDLRVITTHIMGVVDGTTKW